MSKARMSPTTTCTSTLPTAGSRAGSTPGCGLSTLCEPCSRPPWSPATRTQVAQTTKTPDYTATALLCVKEYRPIVTHTPDKDPIKADTDFEREVVIRNTSNCDWLPGMYLSYSSGERFGAPRKIEMKNTEPVKPGDDARFVFRGHTPKKGNLYSGQWEVRLAGDVLVEPLLTISFYAYE